MQPPDAIVDQSKLPHVLSNRRKTTMLCDFLSALVKCMLIARKASAFHNLAVRLVVISAICGPVLGDKNRCVPDDDYLTFDNDGKAYTCRCRD